MVNHKRTNQSTGKAMLLMEKEHFHSELLKRVEIGKTLALMKAPIQNSSHPYSGYMMGMIKTKLTDEQEECIAEFHKWTGYNSELLKQAFDIPDNEYYRGYMNAGQRIMFSGDEDLFQICKDELKKKIEYLETLVLKISLLPSVTVQTELPKEKDVLPYSRRVFIVHRHDTAIRSQVELFVRQLGYDPIVLFKQPNAGCTIIEKIEREANDLAFAIILYTFCDLGNDKLHADDQLNPRARQNVVFEHGYMCALLGRQKVCALVEAGVEITGDMSGVVYVGYDDKGAWQMSIAKEMKAAGLEIDLNKLV